MWNRNWFIFVLAIFTVVLSQHPGFAEEPLTLNTAIEIALKNSHILKMAREATSGAVAQKREALTGFLPRLSTSYSYTRVNEEPVIKFQGMPLPYSTLGEVPVGSKDNYNWSFELKQPLFAGGAILANYQASSIGESVAACEETAKYQDVVQDVKIAYFNLLRAKRIRDVALQSVEMLKAHRDVAGNYFNVGMIPKNDLLQAEVEMANGQQTLIRAQHAVELAKANFNTVLKRNMHIPVDVVDILSYQPLGRSFEECLNIARQERPELKISSLKVAQAEKLVRISKSDFFPALNVVGTYSRVGDTPSTSGSAYKDMENWQVMAVASWNFWEWGKTKFRVDAAKSRENQALEASRELNDQVALEIKNAYLQLQEAESQIVVSQKVIEQAQENFRISEERYRQSIATSTVVLDAQTLLTKAKSEYANALGDYNISYARLQRAMGAVLKTDDNRAPAAAPAVAEKLVSAVAVPGAITSPARQDVRLEKEAAKSFPEDDIRNLINKWRVDWQSGNMTAYAGCYAPDFKSGGMDLKTWISYKTRIHLKNKPITIRIENLKVSPETSGAKAVFTQYYSSPVLKDKAQKTLIFKNIQGEWKICAETGTALR